MKIEEIEKKYRITADYHTHSVYSRIGFYYHGKGSIMENVRAASEKGIEEVAITDHGPSDFYGLDPKRIPEMRDDIEEAMKAYPGIKVYLGVEADIVDTPSGLDIAPEDFSLFDFVNAGYHYVPNSKMLVNLFSFHLPISVKTKEKLRKQNTERIVRAILNNNIKILTHPGDKAFMDEEAVAKVCAERGTLIEINARHRHPNVEDLRIYAAHDVKFVISSDAHRPQDVGRYAKSLALALEAGIGIERIVNLRKR
ncbi:MAG: PHP domain-containing protein [Mogibacterium sp.]|nr:PHP domain-containing protein [Mogibacterium sp.]